MQFERNIPIAASPSIVWQLLTVPALMKTWMGEPGMELEIHTDWKPGSPITISGFHHVRFENRGTVLAFDVERKLQYSHLSSISRLPDRPESYTVFEFALRPFENGTEVKLNIRNFPTETIFKHLELYWNSTLALIKAAAEKQT